MALIPPLQGDLSRFTSQPAAVDLRGILGPLVQTFLQTREAKKKGIGEARDRSLIESIISGQTPEPFEVQKPEGILANIANLIGGGPVSARQLPVSPVETALATSKITSAAKDRPKRFDLLKQAEKRAQTILGVTDLIGLNPKEKKEFERVREDEFEKLQVQFGLKTKKLGADKKKDPADIVLPPKIETTSAAIKHLTTVEGMTRDEAIAWIKQRL